ncbi:D-alanine-D-alanine ligase [Bacillus cereus HuB4-4]|uniref:D-alanine--D-alanine ligase n=1 Tax=Bacillus cereus HuB4-4 TaxID=1053211 RepID=A0A9W5VMC7_BACCE|nr:D-alanine--D-alanine ligase family protein [Bacillus cereus]EOP90890.1 D-alanine-D-alanine ligase [Bacillus cereus HuB4-4]
MRKKVFVLYGGKSAEHEVSLESALNVLNELNKNQYEVFAVYITGEGKWSKPRLICDEKVLKPQLIMNTKENMGKSMCEFLQQIDENSIVFPVLHGTYGEDGTLQGMLEMLNVAYVGNNVIASAVGMDKVWSKKVFAQHLIPQTPYVYFDINQYEYSKRNCIKDVIKQTGFPCYVKPSNMGSSIGVGYCKDKEELVKAIEVAFSYDNKILIEKEIVGREVIVGVIGNEELHCSLAGEWKREQTFFNFENKYEDENLTPQIPALIPDSTYLQLCTYAKEAYMALEGSGLMRIDFFVTEENMIYLNEVNTLPGFTKHSMFPLLFEKTKGMTYSELLDLLIQLSLLKYSKKNKIQFRRSVL